MVLTLYGFVNKMGDVMVVIAIEMMIVDIRRSYVGVVE